MGACYCGVTDFVVKDWVPNELSPLKWTPTSGRPTSSQWSYSPVTTIFFGSDCVTLTPPSPKTLAMCDAEYGSEWRREF